MRLRYRFGYYLVGFFMGMFVVAIIWSGKDTRCNYFPNARVLNDLRNKPFHYDIEASRRLSEDWVDSTDVKNTLTHGDVDFDKSNEPYRKGKIYVIEGKTANNEEITITMVNYTNKVLLEKIEKK